jgi:hypothetical protein
MLMPVLMPVLMPMLIKRMGDWRSDAYMLYIDHHTPEGLVCLPAAMTQSCAALG